MNRKTKTCPKCHGTGQVTDDIWLGLHMRGLRRQAGHSLRVLAKRMGYSAPYISDLELGRRHWTPELIKVYSYALK